MRDSITLGFTDFSLVSRSHTTSLYCVNWNSGTSQQNIDVAPNTMAGNTSEWTRSCGIKALKTEYVTCSTTEGVKRIEVAYEKGNKIFKRKLVKNPSWKWEDGKPLYEVINLRLIKIKINIWLPKENVYFCLLADTVDPLLRLLKETI